MTNSSSFQSLLDWIDLVSGLVTVSGIVFIAIQVRRDNNREIKEMRPYVHISLQRNKINKDELELHVVNLGRTPAYSLEIDFSEIHPWCFVQPQSHHFLHANGGIQRLLPNEYLTYYIGKVRDLSNLKDNATLVTVTYEMNSPKKLFSEKQPYCITGNNYLRSRAKAQ